MTDLQSECLYRREEKEEEIQRLSSESERSYNRADSLIDSTPVVCMLSMSSLPGASP